MAEPKVRDAKLSEFQPDEHNANKGTERGRYMLETSVDDVGSGRSLVADKHGRVVAGNKTQEVFIQAGMEDAIVVETDGKRPIIHVRTDWDLDDPDPNNPARRYAYWDNRTGEVGYELDPEQVKVDLAAGFDFSTMYHEFELDLILGEVNEPPSLDDLADEYGESESRDFWPVLKVQVSPETLALYESLKAQTGIEDEAEVMAQILGAVDATILGSL